MADAAADAAPAAGAAAPKSAAPAASEDPETWSTIKHLKGKYGWEAGENKATEFVPAGAIANYGWADGTKNVSIYVDVADDVPEDAVTLASTAESFTLTVQDRRLHIPKLAHEISGATFARKAGKNQLVVKLAKKEQHAWHKLQGEVTKTDSGYYTKEDVKSRVT
eukprot:TRINITY_DN64330_c0_g1_i1.p1 TRINITY_DN64330_c0_g1~~TRINITY_DN64330_c0_g1_i1.p1  ORF type:complete len:189 (+),score=52.97 TRINITY_DN64330_c0_g1_i1:73-567(+)